MKKFTFIGLAMGLVLILAACGPTGERPDESGEIVILQIDEEGGMRFEPGAIILQAGQRVRIVVENRGEKDHEFMIGRNVVRSASGAPDGFEIDFFEGIEDLVTVELGANTMLMIDGETVMMSEMGMGMGEEENMGMGAEEEEDTEMGMGEGEAGDEHEDDDEHDEDALDHMGWMLMSPAGSGTTIIEFTVPDDRAGKWEMACFEDDGSHYEDGMKGTVTIEQ